MDGPNSVRVQAGATLTVEPGTTVRFAEGTFLVIEGTLIADGREGAPILFTADSADPGPGSWGGYHSMITASIIFLVGSTSATLDADGEYLSGSIIRNAVVEYGMGIACRGSSPLVEASTIRHHGGVIAGALAAMVDSSTLPSDTAPVLRGNSILGNPTEYAFWYAGSEGVTMDISGNYWGTTSAAEIESMIRHSQDDFTLGTALYSPFLTEADPDAPAHVASATVGPGDPVGLEQATFTVRFSAAMDTSVMPQVSFRLSRGGTWTQYTRANSGLPADTVGAITAAPDGSLWFGTEGGGVARYDGQNWVTYNTRNSGLGENLVRAIAVAGNDDVWFGHYGRSDVVVSHYEDGNWTAYSRGACEGLDYLVMYEVYAFEPAPEPIEGLCDAYDIAVDGKGSVYFATEGVMQYDGLTWRLHNSENGLPDDWVDTLTAASDGSVWAGTESAGAARFDGSAWSTFDLTNSELPSLRISGLAASPDGSVWFGTYGNGLARFDGAAWTAYPSTSEWAPEGPPSYSYALAAGPDGDLWVSSSDGLVHYDGAQWVDYGLPIGSPTYALAVGRHGNVWSGTNEQGVIAMWRDQPYALADGGGWLDEYTWQGTYDVSSLIQRGDYTVEVSNAVDAKGFVTPTDARFGFTVDYPIAITDVTAPAAPNLYASGIPGDASAATARWSAADPESAVNLYRFAIGSTQGGSNVLGWSETMDVTWSQTGLVMTEGARYWMSVRARNEAGLWSDPTEQSFIAGQFWPGDVYLPLASR